MDMTMDIQMQADNSWSIYKLALEDTEIEFIENHNTAIARLQKLKLELSSLTAPKHLSIMAYTLLLTAAIDNLKTDQNRMFYFPIPWSKRTGLPSHPSLIADARHYCRMAHLKKETESIISSFAEWRVFMSQKIFCCCGKKSSNLHERIIPIDIVIHHPLRIIHEHNDIEIKQLIGIRSDDRDHMEHHYNLRRDSRVDDNISIIGESLVKIDFTNFRLFKHEEKYSKQLNLDLFRKMFIELCENSPFEPV